MKWAYAGIGRKPLVLQFAINRNVNGCGGGDALMVGRNLPPFGHDGHHDAAFGFNSDVAICVKWRRAIGSMSAIDDWIMGRNLIGADEPGI